MLLHLLTPAKEGMQGVFGFLISLASFLSIKVTSPVTHSMSPLISPSDPALTP